jgi:hypothetical protein
MAIEQGNEAFTSTLTTQPPERLEDWEIGLSSSIVFDTLPTPEPQASSGHGVVQEGIHQRGLADPWLPGHEHHLPLAGQGSLQPAVEVRQLHLSPHDHRVLSLEC